MTVINVQETRASVLAKFWREYLVVLMSGGKISITAAFFIFIYCSPILQELIN